MIQLRIDIRKILTWKYLLYLKLVNYKDALRRPYYIKKKKINVTFEVTETHEVSCLVKY